jgi:hypothetical protein
VDIAGNRLKSSFGTALKFWAHSGVATLAIYALLFLLVRQVIDVWPSGPPGRTLFAPIPAPKLPRPDLPSLPIPGLVGASPGLSAPEG